MGSSGSADPPRLIRNEFKFLNQEAHEGKPVHFLLLTFFVVFVSIVFQDLRAYAFSTCEKSSSTGVDRPKIVTDTRSLLFS